MDSDSSPVFKKVVKDIKSKFNSWLENLKQEEAKKSTPLFKTSFDHLFPSKNDSPNQRQEKFETLCEIWRPKNDLFWIQNGTAIGLIVSSAVTLPFLFSVRRLLKVTSFNRIIAIASSIGMATGSATIVLKQQISEIIRGEVECAECHLIRTGAYQFLFTSGFAASNSILVSSFSAFTNPGITLPIDVLDRWSSLKEGVKIISRAIYTRNLILGFLALACVNVTVGIAVVYYSMKEYHDVHAALLDEQSKQSIL